MTVNVKRQQVARQLIVDEHVIQFQIVVGIIHHPTVVWSIVALLYLVTGVGYNLIQRG